MTREDVEAWLSMPCTQFLVDAYSEAVKEAFQRKADRSALMTDTPEEFWRLSVKDEVFILDHGRVVQTLSDVDAYLNTTGLEVDDE